MTGSLDALVAATAVFGFGHFLLSSRLLRAPLVRILGKGGFLPLYSIAVAAAFLWMLAAYREAPALEVWTSFPVPSFSASSVRCSYLPIGRITTAPWHCSTISPGDCSLLTNLRSIPPIRSATSRDSFMRRREPPLSGPRITAMFDIYCISPFTWTKIGIIMRRQTGAKQNRFESSPLVQRRIILARLDRKPSGPSIFLRRLACAVSGRVSINPFRYTSSQVTKMTLHAVNVRAPASYANLGPGFDCIGMALDIWNELTLTRGEFSVSATGEGADLVPLDRSNLVVTGVEAVFDFIGEPVPDLRYECTNRIPFSRGMGSSSAAIVIGLVAGSAISGADLSKEQLTVLAADIEGHPDNVAPAIYGGCTIGVRNGDAGWIVDRVSIPEGLNAVLFVPDMQMNTNESRGLLPDQVSRADAVFNIGRSALLVNALSTGRLELLRYATDDRLHQPQRAETFRPMTHLIKAALVGGAHGAFLSGAGPSVLALATGREVTISYEMAETARHFGVDGKTMIMAVSPDGASVISRVSGS